MSYIPLGPRAATGHLGQYPPGTDPAAGTGLYWTIMFTASDMNVATGIRYYEVYRASVQGTADSTCMLYVENYLFDQNATAQSLSWDWTQPLHVTRGQSIYVYVWYPPDQAAAPAPRATIWLRYDPALQLSSVNVA